MNIGDPSIPHSVIAMPFSIRNKSKLIITYLSLASVVITECTLRIWNSWCPFWCCTFIEEVSCEWNGAKMIDKSHSHLSQQKIATGSTLMTEEITSLWLQEKKPFISLFLAYTSPASLEIYSPANSRCRCQPEKFMAKCSIWSILWNMMRDTSIQLLLSLMIHSFLFPNGQCLYVTVS